MRVLVIDPPAFTPPYDHALCEALAARGHDVELVTAHFTHGEAPRPAGYRRRRTFGPPLSGLVAARPRSRLRVPLKLAGHGAGLVALAARAARTRPDIVHWQWAPLPRLDTHAIRLVGARAGATVITAHDVLPRRSASEVALWRGLYRHCERVIAHSEASRTRLLSEVGLEPGRVALVPHGLFTAAGPPVSPTRTGTRLLFFGLIRPDKGLDLLIEALPAVLRSVPDAGLRVVGSPRMPLEPLRERAAALGVAGAIEWDLRFVPDGEIAGVFAAASVVCTALPGDRGLRRARNRARTRRAAGGHGSRVVPRAPCRIRPRPGGPGERPGRARGGHRARADGRSCTRKGLRRHGARA